MYELPADAADEGIGGGLAMDLAATKRRIAEVVRVLDSFGKMRAPGRSRSEYVQQLKKDCATYYGYNSFMIDVFFNLFSPAGATSSCNFFSFYLCFLDFAIPGCEVGLFL